MVQRINNQSEELAHIGLYKIRFLIKNWRKVRQVGGDDLVNVAFVIIVVETVKAVCEKPESSAYKDSAGIAFLELLCHIQHTPSGRDHIIYDDHIFPAHVVAEKFVCDDRILSAYDS